MKPPLAPLVVEALASAFLSRGPWTRRALIARGVVTIGDEPKWMPRVVESVLARFPRPPRAKFRSLARHIASLALLTNQREGDSPSVVRSLVGELSMGESRWDVPSIATTGELARRAPRLEALVTAIVHDEGFVVNHRKTRVMRAGVRQLVTGLVVNERLNPTRDSFDRLKATLHNCVRRGPESEDRRGDRENCPDFRAHLKGRLTGRLRLGATSNSSAEALGRVLTLLAERCPEVEVALQHGTSLEVLGGIRSGSLDAGFSNEAAEPDAVLATVEVARFAVYLAAPPGLVRITEPLDWEALAELPWISPTSSTCCGHAAESLFKAHGIRPKKITNVDRENVTRTLVAGGVGLGILHADTAHEARAAGEVDLVCEAPDRVRVLRPSRWPRPGAAPLGAHGDRQDPLKA